MSDQVRRLTAALADRYAIERELGAGGMATVFLAEDLKHHRKVAVKVLKPELTAAVGAERFLREIEIAARLHHPHILSLYDSGEASGFLYFVMPYVGGESLRARLNREKQLPLKDALRIAREVADALGYAHAQGVIHRDIKPENIMLESNHALVADFGIARAVSAAGGERLTETGMAVGTPPYMSPEQAAGEAELDGRSDLYSLGCVLYEMLAGQPPFTGPTAESIVRQHMVVQPPDVTNIRARVPAGVVSALRIALGKSRADRQGSMAEFAEQLSVEPTPALPAATVEVAIGSRRRRQLGVIGVVALLAVAVGIVATVMRGSGPVESGLLRLTVLPFENLGAPDDEYFAAGITDEITARLAGVSGLSIIARQSAIQYKNSTKTPQEIGSELQVEYLLEATLSWQHSADGSSRVRVRPQLIRTSDASHVWADVYDEDLTEVFQVQTSIAERVVNALGLALLEPRQQSLELTPTGNLEAYDFYLRANDYFRRTVSEENYQVAERLYTMALDRDPDFAVALSQLSLLHSRSYWYFFDRSEDRLARAKDAAETALALGPDLPQAHLALAEYYYMGRRDYDRALRQLTIATRERPNDSELLSEIGAIQRRRGSWREAAKTLDRVSELEPRSASHALQAGITHVYARGYPDAERHFTRALAFALDEVRPYVWLARLALAWQGDTARARSLLQNAYRVSPRALDPQAWWHWALIRILDGPSPQTEHRLSELYVDSVFFHLAAAELHSLAGRQTVMQASYESARLLLETRSSERPDEPRFHSELGLAYAGLGRGDEAIREAQMAIDLQPPTKDAILGPDWIWNLARVHVMLGKPDAAILQLERMLSLPSPVSAHWLRLDPIWKPLHGHPRFEQLLTVR
jgi:serine/threonine-protein kinase